jgi:hypothetical protein
MSVNLKTRIIYIIIALITIFQICLQPVLLDESYYAFFASDVSFGYMDHPPMVAWVISIGNLLGGGVIGLRMFNLILLLGAVFFVDKLIDSKSVWKYGFIFAFPVLHVLHLSIPDSSLILGTAAFFYYLKRYLFQDSWLNVLFLSLSIMFMVYSKYHGILTLCFSILFVLELFKRISFYYLIGVVILGMLPHLFWQIDYDYISLQYHFKERRRNVFELHNVADYLISSPLILAGFMALIVPFKKAFDTAKSKFGWTKFEQVLLANIIGFFVFFLFQSSKGIVEVNWLFSASIPVMILLGNRLNFDWKWNKIVIVTSLVVFISIRLMLMLGLVPRVGYLFQYSGYKKWSSEITKHANGLPVVFQDSYQLASMYGFQTSNVPFSFNTIESRINQYSLSNADQTYNGKIVKVYQPYSPFILSLKTTNTSKGALHYYIDSNFCVVNNLWISPSQIDITESRDSLRFECSMQNRGGYDLEKLILQDRLKLVMSQRFSWDERTLVDIYSDNFTINKNRLVFSVSYSQDVTYEYKLGFAVDNKCASINSSLLQLEEF